MDDNKKALHAQALGALLIDALAHDHALKLLEEQISVLSALVSVSPSECSTPNLSPCFLARSAWRTACEIKSTLEEARPAS